MQHERDGRLKSARTSAASFPAELETKDERPSHADASHVARRRVSSAPAHEVDLDEVQLVDEAPLLLLQPPIEETSPLPPSTPPLAIDVSPPRAPFHVPLSAWVPRPRRSVAVALACAGFAAMGVIAALLWQAPAEVPASPPTLYTAVEGSPSPAIPAATQLPPPVAAPRGIPEVDVTALPRASMGVVIGSPGHRLWIDGTLAATWQAPVKCGSHVVQVGSAGTPRTVDIPCGQEVKVLP